MQFLFELLLQPIFELVFYGIGYATAWVVVPLLTFGYVTVEPSRSRPSFKSERRRFQRTSPRGYVIEGEMAACVGWLFWIVVAVIVWAVGRS